MAEVRDSPTTELAVVLRDSGLDADKTQVLSSRFADYFTIADQWKREAQVLTVTDEGQTELMKRARQGRLVLKDKRVQIERTRKELKEASLQEGRAIDAVAKLLTSLIEPTEKFLQEQETFAERAEAQRQAERQQLIAARRAALQLVGGEGTDDFLAESTDESFAVHLRLCRDNYEAHQREKAAEAERQREQDQRNREELLKENQRLEEQRRQEQEQAQAEQRRLQAELDKQRQAEQERQAQEQKRRRAEQQAEQEKQLAAARLAAAPDKEKMVALADSILLLTSTAIPTVNTEKARTVVGAASDTLHKIQNWLREQADIL